MNTNEKKHIAKFQFTQYVFDELTFKIDKICSETDSEEEPKLSFNIKTGVPAEVADTDKGHVLLSCNIKASPNPESCFSLNVVMRGDFKTDRKVTKEEMQSFLEVHGTTAMFPFLRSAVADLTRIGNVSPLLLPLINIRNLIKEGSKKK